MPNTITLEALPSDVASMVKQLLSYRRELLTTVRHIEETLRIISFIYEVRIPLDEVKS